MNAIIKNYVHGYAVDVDWSRIFPVRLKVAKSLMNIFPALVGYQVSCHGYIRKDHECILTSEEACRRMKKAGVSASLRSRILEATQGMGCFFADEAPLLDVYVIMDGQPVTIIDEGQCLFPTPFPLSTWKRITEAMQPEEYAQANWPKRRRMILNTIRHNVGFYDCYSKMMDNESAMRLFVDYVKRYFPVLVTGLSDFLEKKAHYGLKPVKSVMAAEVDDEACDEAEKRRARYSDLYELTYEVFSGVFSKS